jgi:protein-S-isoprenylcysteine O-methyltransferase Ste14
MKADETDTAGVIAPPPVIYAATLALSIILHRLFPLRLMPGNARSIRRPAGIALIVAGLIPAAWAARTMHRHGNSPDPNHPVASLVVDGPFRFSRNPIYLSLTACYLGVGMLLGTVWHLLLLPLLMAVMRRGVVDREEAYLSRRFGEEYRVYMADVRRWI